GFFAIPLNVEASSKDDTPAMLYTPPQLSSSPFVTTVGSMDGSLVVETFVDANGRVADYRVLSAPSGTENLRHELDNMMIFTTFRPAMNLGRPTAGRVVLSFSAASRRVGGHGKIARTRDAEGVTPRSGARPRSSRIADP